MHLAGRLTTACSGRRYAPPLMLCVGQVRFWPEAVIQGRVPIVYTTLADSLHAAQRVLIELGRLPSVIFGGIPERTGSKKNGADSLKEVNLTLRFRRISRASVHGAVFATFFQSNRPAMRRSSQISLKRSEPGTVIGYYTGGYAGRLAYLGLTCKF